MEHLVPTVPSARWGLITQREYGLTRTEFGTLLAICCFVRELRAAVPRDMLEQARDRGLSDIDMATPGRLYHLGLIKLLSSGRDRYYAPTPEGWERIDR